MRLGVLGERERVARRGQEAQVDRVDEQLRRGADLHRGEFPDGGAAPEAQAQARLHPLGGQHRAPGVAGVGQRVVLQFAVAEPAPARAFEGLRLAAADADGPLAVVDRRTVAGARDHAHDLAVESLARGQVDVARPLPVRGPDLDQGGGAQAFTQRGACAVGELADLGRAPDRGDGLVGRREIQALVRHAVEVVGRLRQLARRVHRQGAPFLAVLALGRDQQRPRAIRRDQTHHQEGLARADQVGLAVAFARARRDDLALGEEHLRGQVAFQVVARGRGIKGQAGFGGRRRGGRGEAGGGEDQARKHGEAHGGGRAGS